MADKPKKKMTKGELRNTVSGLIKDATNFAVDELGPERAKATKYYLGKPFGNEEDGRSQFVMTEVRDTVLGVIPGLLRVIFGPDHTVEYAPRNKNQVEVAEQITDYARWVFEEDNPGLLVTHSVLMDGLVRKLGIYKWGVDEHATLKAIGAHATQSQIEQLLQQPEFEITRAVRTKEAVPPSQPILGPDGAPVSEGSPGEEAEYDIEFTHTDNEKRIWIRSVPPEEFIYNREARTLADATLVGHRMRRSKSELLMLGVKEADIDEHGGDDTGELNNEEVQARNTSANASVQQDEDAGEANNKHLYVESYVKIDFDGDGVAELRKVCTLGPGHYVVMNEPADSRPFSIFTPIPEPHVLLGLGYADLTMDLQLLKSSMMRAVQDSAAASIFPRMGYVEGHVSVADIMNTAMGGPIRMRQQGDIQAITVPFLGADMLPLIGYIDDVKENRTGQSKGAIGLDADALQSTEKAAAGAVVSATQAREEVLARIFAEQALKPMFRGILELIGEIKPKKRMIKMRGSWTEIDPESWDLNLDVSVNVMLGTAMKEQKLAALESFAAKQEFLLQTLGPDNPISNLRQYSNTLRKATKLLGFPDVDAYFGQVPEGYQPPEPQPDPAEAKAQADAEIAKARLELDAQKLQMESQVAQAKLMIEQQKLEATMQKDAQELLLRETEITAEAEASMRIDDRERERQIMEHALEVKRMELEYETKITLEGFKADNAGAIKEAELDAANSQEAAKVAAQVHVGEIKAALQHERSEMNHEEIHGAEGAKKHDHMPGDK